uniref:Glycosyltransferase 2-like domain-containing protein n=1 Tax=Guillardia theta TaxID=55529 RepID=A0A7S4KRW6_GUITH
MKEKEAVAPYKRILDHPVFLFLVLSVESFLFLHVSLFHSLVVSAFLASYCKKHFLRIAILGLPLWATLQSLLSVVFAGLFQVFALLALHEILRPVPRDRNLVGEGFEDPSRPGALCAFVRSESEATLKLSVVLPVMDDGHWLTSTIPQILRNLQSQEQRNSSHTFEVILVVHSSDKTGAYSTAIKQVRAFGVDKVRALRLSRRCSQGRAFREGALRARGEFLMFLDKIGAMNFVQVDGKLVDMQWLQQSPSSAANRLLILHTRNMILTASPPTSAEADDPVASPSKSSRMSHSSSYSLTSWFRQIPQWAWNFLVLLLFPSLLGIQAVQWTVLVASRKQLLPALARRHLHLQTHHVELLLLFRSRNVQLIEDVIDTMSRNTVSSWDIAASSITLVHLFLLRFTVLFRGFIGEKSWDS